MGKRNSSDLDGDCPLTFLMELKLALLPDLSFTQLTTKKISLEICTKCVDSNTLKWSEADLKCCLTHYFVGSSTLHPRALWFSPSVGGRDFTNSLSTSRTIIMSR
ncbi:hypothetical protein Nepgr_025698 [Nepenthes gracilis]|uniref:Uncharacterized protein n=1 Tax=Nepenthes gracilis TaxID=150966 RepID=A0AAD3T5J6_NEPGR|nr:hypothetical protein Nepgr_025698 [Nepenthes gracilis]